VLAREQERELGQVQERQQALAQQV